MKEIVVGRFGGPEELVLRDRDVPPPAEGEVQVRQAAVGVNFIDVLLRRGELGGTPPAPVGLEAAGRVVAVGAGVNGVAVGDRVVYAGGAAGAYCDIRNVRADRIIATPPSLSDDDAAAIFFKALTADYLIHKLRPLTQDDTVLFHGAAGGVGSIAIPWLRSLGVSVVGTTSKPDKAAYAHSLGCQRVAVLGQDDVADAVRDVSGGKGASVVYDSIGRATIDASFASLARFGLLVTFGWASGDIDPIPPAKLRERGSVFVTRPTVSHYIEARDDYVAAAGRVFAALAAGVFSPHIHETVALGDAGRAHHLLETGGHRGSVILRSA
ncbi:MAG: quinone oxidoreductase [Variovorax sp.]|nr:MAG: quinone oxidoreductase [Variovorax sp.]